MLDWRISWNWNLSKWWQVLWQMSNANCSVVSSGIMPPTSCTRIQIQPIPIAKTAWFGIFGKRTISTEWALMINYKSTFILCLENKIFEFYADESTWYCCRFWQAWRSCRRITSHWFWIRWNWLCDSDAPAWQWQTTGFSTSWRQSYNKQVSCHSYLVDLVY